MSLRVKTILGIALIEGVLLISLILLMMDFIRESNYDSLIKRASTTATLFATTTKDAVLTYDLASLDSFVNEVLRNPDLVYARVVSRDGQLFAEAGDRSHLQGGVFALDKDVEQITDDVFDTAAVIAEGGVIYGQVEIGIHIGSITRAIQAVKQWSALLATVEMGLVALFSFILGGYLTGQLKTLQQAAHSVAAGNLDTVLPARGHDEVAVVSRAFNSMARNLKKASLERQHYESQLLELNQSLENRVRKRTTQLQEKNFELEQTLESLKETQTKLTQAEKMASLGVLSAGVAHEINNPLGFVLNNLTILHDYIGLYEKVVDEYTRCCELPDGRERSAQVKQLQQWLLQENFGFIREDIQGLLQDSSEGTDRIRDIVSGLRDFSHMEQAGRLSMADLNQCVTSTLKMLHGELKYKCRVKLDLNDLPDTCCAPGQISQVLLNLLVNAGHAVDQDGEIEISSQHQDGQITIAIRDNGVGIEPAALPKLFDPFYTTKPVGEGTGLGLSVSYGIIKEHQGEITVSSEPGKGSCFTIILPVRASG